jgi:hypothetical protein
LEIVTGDDVLFLVVVVDSEVQVPGSSRKGAQDEERGEDGS